MSPSERSDLRFARNHRRALGIELLWYSLCDEYPPMLIKELFETSWVELSLTGEFDA